MTVLEESNLIRALSNNHNYDFQRVLLPELTAKVFSGPVVLQKMRFQTKNVLLLQTMRR